MAHSRLAVARSHFDKRNTMGYHKVEQFLVNPLFKPSCQWTAFWLHSQRSGRMRDSARFERKGAENHGSHK